MNPYAIVLLLITLTTGTTVQGAGLSTSELGRLFFSAEQRAALDRARERQAQAALEPQVEIADEFLVLEPDPELPEVTLEQPQVRIDGYVSRPNGSDTVWVNDINADLGNLDELGIDSSKVRLESSRVRLPVGPAPAGVLLKPGQTFDPNSTEIHDAYERGREQSTPPAQ